MKLTVLCDNNTFIDRYFLGEPGLSFLIETAGKRILFDTGYSDVFLRNASKVGESLLNLDIVVLSHGHLDHTWGLIPLIQALQEGKAEKRPYQIPLVVGHSQVFEAKEEGDGTQIGSLLSEENLSRYFLLELGDAPIKLSKNLFFLGEIPRTNTFESQEPVGYRWEGNKKEPDYLMDDSALVYHGEKGLVIITGCAHSGICNIVDYAKVVCNENRIQAIIGGFHLLSPSPERMESTSTHLRRSEIQAFYPCHCTDLPSILALSQVAPVSQVGSGLSLLFV